MYYERNDNVVIAKVDKAVNFASKKGAELVNVEAKRRCPVGDYERASAHIGDWKQRKKGSLRKSIKIKKSKYKNGGYLVTAGGYNTYYAVWVELGAPARSSEQWKKAGHSFPVPRQPFLRPAANANKSRINSIFQNELNKAL